MDILTSQALEARCLFPHAGGYVSGILGRQESQEDRDVPAEAGVTRSLAGRGDDGRLLLSGGRHLGRRGHGQEGAFLCHGLAEGRGRSCGGRPEVVEHAGTEVRRQQREPDHQ